MIVRRVPSGAWQPCRMREIKAGDVFYTCDEAGRGPLLKAGADARLVEHPCDRRRQVWDVSVLPAPACDAPLFSDRVH
jgi:hypothetical protein